MPRASKTERNDERRMLRKHGTDVFTLHPRNVVQAAERDLRTKKRRREVQSGRKEYRKAAKAWKAAASEAERASLSAKMDETSGWMGADLPPPQYAFRRDHAERALNVRELIRLAIDEPDWNGEGREDSYNTTLLYEQPALLRAALALAEAA